MVFSDLLLKNSSKYAQMASFKSSFSLILQGKRSTNQSSWGLGGQGFHVPSKKRTQDSFSQKLLDQMELTTLGSVRIMWILRKSLALGYFKTCFKSFEFSQFISLFCKFVSLIIHFMHATLNMPLPSFVICIPCLHFFQFFALHKTHEFFARLLCSHIKLKEY